MFADDDALVRLFDIDVVEGEHRPSYNQAPSQLIRTVRMDNERQRRLELSSWGLLPFWAKESFKPLINARAETVTVKPSFKSAVASRRCLVPTNGYYEWQPNRDGSKQAWFLSLADNSGNSARPGSEPIVAMAGIFDWRSNNNFGEESFTDVGADRNLGEAKNATQSAATCAIVTREAADTLGHIHPRMPLFIPKSHWDLWLNPDVGDLDEIQVMIDSFPPAPLAPRMVGTAVGNVRNNSFELIAPFEMVEATLPGFE